MKIPYVVGLVVIAVAATFLIQESRMAGLRDRLATAENSGGGTPDGRMIRPVSPPSDSETPPAIKTRVVDRPAPAQEPASGESDEGDFGKTVRKMWDNPAGKSMMNQGVKMAVAMMYGDFIDGLDLTKEEADYFRDLLGSETATQQELGMKMMGATPEERKELMEEMERRNKENEEAIKTFLNNDGDYERFEAYQDRLPERQQLDGLRTAMAGNNTPLDGETEGQLVEAMHRARTQAGVKDLSGAEGMKSLAGGNLVRDFEDGWETQQAALRTEVAGILSEDQQKAFFEYQTQMKEFQLMSIKMAEKMMAPAEDSE